MNKQKVLAIVGQTASGKTSLSIELAKQFGGEVISCDSRQVYRGLDIGTGKVTETEKNGVTHHLIDIVEVNNTYTATNFVGDATRAIHEIMGRSALPIIAGGTFFYLDRLRGKGIGPDVPPNPKLRTELEELPKEILYKQLAEVDQKRAATIDRDNKRRLIRSLEIADALGYVPETRDVESPYEWLVIGIERDKESLRNRYKKRAEAWIAEGILDETIWLKDQVTAARFGEFGFEYILADRVLRGEITPEEFVQEFIQKNWQYAKRQMVWLKRDAAIKWFKPSDLDQIHECVSAWLNA